MNKDQLNTLQDMINTFGAAKQIPWTIEECAELSVVLAKILRGGHVDRSVVLDELADVIIVSNTLRLIYGPYGVDMTIKSKMDIIRARIKTAKSKLKEINHDDPIDRRSGN